MTRRRGRAAGALGAIALVIASCDRRTASEHGSATSGVASAAVAPAAAPATPPAPIPRPTEEELRRCSRDADCTSSSEHITGEGDCCISCAHGYSIEGLALFERYCSARPRARCGSQPRCRPGGPPRCEGGLCTLREAP